MKELFVPYIIAKELRDLGFDEEVFTAYEIEDKSLIIQDDYLFAKVVNNPYTIPAPTYPQAVNWIVKNHSLFVSAVLSKKGSSYCGKIETTGKVLGVVHLSKVDYDNIEDAYNDGLTVGINMIKLIKSKK